MFCNLTFILEDNQPYFKKGGGEQPCSLTEGVVVFIMLSFIKLHKCKQGGSLTAKLPLLFIRLLFSLFFFSAVLDEDIYCVEILNYYCLFFFYLCSPYYFILPFLPPFSFHSLSFLWNRTIHLYPMKCQLYSQPSSTFTD